MSTIGEAMQGFIGTAVDSSIKRICQRLYEDVPIIMVFRDVVSKASEYRVVLSLDRAADLRTIRFFGEVLYTKQAA